ncbi:Glutathionyl-hydroquinone reductase YqjG [Vibrio aerogenes CECT 7868]|uniref:Glutathionyl-hydroquinone reductase YqjG n=1 Tax=Vibrio aerogenes CECT 7868 TaxID=1216006 RepID=A0A1M5Z738_9VIBR|nr:glutathione S-transferase C-terminal domain-containing protein [Vibrio aerogenes]SHI19908.1 Glutathionyl-hydroquinone reductase YqjG [Vibrio aerogenes CECT 7868]
MLVNGKWTKDWTPVQAKDDKGRFVRQVSEFRHWITPDGEPGPTGEGGFKAEKGRYHLYVGYICPWASRTLMVRALKQLQDYITVTVVNPVMTDQGWQFDGFPGSHADELNGHQYIHQLYTQVAPEFTGRATVPVLWDKKLGTIVNNESADIIKMLNSAFDHLTGSTLNLRPDALQQVIDEQSVKVYDQLNNGVYKAGFASTQFAYEEAYNGVFSMLDMLEKQLSDGRKYLLGADITELDIRTFVTLIRFDVAYYGLFKCNRNQIADMPFLSKYVQRILEIEGIRDTVRIDHIKHGYYSIKALNPNGIVPAGPDLDIIG